MDLALTIYPAATLVERNSRALKRLGLEPAFSSQAYALNQELLALSSRRAAHLQESRESTRSRDKLLYEIRKRVKRYRVTLRYVHRDNPDLLRRIASAYNRKKRVAERGAHKHSD